MLSPRRIALNYNPLLILQAFECSKWRHDGYLVFKVHDGAWDDEGLAKVRSEVEISPCAHRVRFALPCRYQELPDLFRMADLGISLVRVDGTPSTFFEFMAVGTPMVCADIKAYDGIIEDGVTGLRTQCSPDAVARTLDRALAHRELLADVRRAGMRWVRSNAEWNRTVDRFEEIYKDVAS